MGSWWLSFPLQPALGVPGEGRGPPPMGERWLFPRLGFYECTGLYLNFLM